MKLGCSFLFKSSAICLVAPSPEVTGPAVRPPGTARVASTPCPREEPDPGSGQGRGLAQTPGVTDAQQPTSAGLPRARHGSVEHPGELGLRRVAAHPRAGVREFTGISRPRAGSALKPAARQPKMPAVLGCRVLGMRVPNGDARHRHRELLSFQTRRGLVMWHLEIALARKETMYGQNVMSGVCFRIFQQPGGVVGAQLMDETGLATWSLWILCNGHVRSRLSAFCFGGLLESYFTVL